MAKPGSIDRRVVDLGPVESIPLGEGRELRVSRDRTIAVFRSRNGNLYATQASCPHRGGPLADGVVGGNVLICPLHAVKFDLETGAALGGACEALKTYDVEASAAGTILLRMGEP